LRRRFQRYFDSVKSAGNIIDEKNNARNNARKENDKDNNKDNNKSNDKDNDNLRGNSEINIGSLYRGESKRILKDIENGDLDIIIGTHGLLSDRIKYKNLGLIIIDEEQKFGVKHKEMLKSRRLDVNILSMSATPIPRTFNMALSQIKDISVIATPPDNRKPIKNFSARFDWQVISKAIKTEVNRGGQVYFLHNRVKDIEKIALNLNTLLPDIRIDVAHGQMSIKLLRQIMGNFAEGKIDVLVSTTIIENGLDLPNVNTLIVDDVEILGLAQMYQIRGRIGRGDKQAYAYFMYKKLRGD